MKNSDEPNKTIVLTGNDTEAKRRVAQRFKNTG